MGWIAFYVGISVLGLAVLAAISLRLWGQVKAFGHEVSAAGAKITAITDELSRLTPPDRADR